jgi:hypothetical protein
MRQSRRKTLSIRQLGIASSCWQYPLAYGGGMCGKTHKPPSRSGRMPGEVVATNYFRRVRTRVLG